MFFPLPSSPVIEAPAVSVALWLKQGKIFTEQIMKNVHKQVKWPPGLQNYAVSGKNRFMRLVKSMIKRTICNKQTAKYTVRLDHCMRRE